MPGTAQNKLEHATLKDPVIYKRGERGGGGAGANWGEQGSAKCCSLKQNKLFVWGGLQFFSAGNWGKT